MGTDNVWQLLADSVEKSAIVSTAEKYALELEIFTLRRVFPRSDFVSRRARKAFSGMSMQAVWKNRFFFNRISRSPPVIVTNRAGQIRCNRWSERPQMTGQVECKQGRPESALD